MAARRHVSTIALGASMLLAVPAAALAQPSANSLLGPAWGVRPWLNQYGVTFGLSEISEVFGNTSGGLHQGATYDGLTELSVGVDLGRAFGLSGGTVNVSAFQIHGRSLSQDNLSNLNTISGIEASRAERLWELWYDQQFRDGQIDTKIGLQSLDQEFITSASAGLFANTVLGWPGLPSYDLYAGGPAYPLSSLGARVRGSQGPFTLLAGVFDDNPGERQFNNDPQPRAGADNLFNLRTGALFIAELDYALNAPSAGQTVIGDGSAPTTSGLPGTYKLGAWFDTAAFPDPEFSTLGQPLITRLDPTGADAGAQRMRRHNFSLYGVADQTIWRPDPAGARMVNIFTRLMGAPGDRNLIDFASNVGIVLKDPLPGRDADSLGLAGGYTKLGSHAIAYSRDQNAFDSDDGYFPVRSGEGFLELTYQYVPNGWLTIAPDAQYIFLPGGGIANPNETGRRISNELVLGARGNINF